MGRKASKEPSIRDDLMAAARYLAEDGAALDGEEALLIGLRLAELAGAIGTFQVMGAEDGKA